uniref:SET domain-containing protein n=1 Tax=Panagrolaimus sp. PS1159 TaxID=55785 RepID=A0AC35ESC1_9BILA
VNTRCIYFYNNSNKHELIDSSSTQGDSIAVIPMMDMLNHDPEANCLPGFDKYSQKYRVTVGDRMVMENEQLFVCYGPHDNGKLWVEYGFRLPNNIFNNISINFNLLLAIFPKINFIPRPANIQAVKEAGFSCNLYGSEESISYGLQKTCILFLLSPSELHQWKRIIYDEEYLEVNSDLIVGANELALKIIKEISNRIQTKLEKSDKTVASLYSDQLQCATIL